MARCWTCGSSVASAIYKCSACVGVAQLKGLGDDLESIKDDIEKGITILEELNSSLASIGSVLEWGFGEIAWRQEQQTDILRGIDATLRTPGETRANELRLQAEELRHRGLYPESEELFLKAIDEYRLDYRMYVGLAETYLRVNEFDKAHNFLERSLPHAPKRDIDYKSHSYRLIGHIHASREDYEKAFQALVASITFSPEYAEGLYDFAQYGSLLDDDTFARVASPTLSAWGGNWALGDRDLVLHLALQKAIQARPAYYYLAEHEPNFDGRKKILELTLKVLLRNARAGVENFIRQADYMLELTGRVSAEAGNAARRARYKDVRSPLIFADAQLRLDDAKQKVASGDYSATLAARPIAEQALQLLGEAKEKAAEEYPRFKEISRGRFKGTIAALTVSLFGGFFAFVIGGGIGNWIAGDMGFIIGGLIGIGLGVLIFFERRP
ncbi:hypothetical protein A3F27_01385 [Candidatus Kaiserbacteria bacterium RIFCSPHIGHO2_12_FULL_53_13]|uniref:Uncharacterized protein n=1 Tax=Candidatus Kaiserbacteria bacterium RIFCSPHIGHO2_12_FULL_53_13 TaxID=1798502 RepID=A0A1F6E6T9_9BACT|nr:MAG: hypothetical protein A3F27_01385 [Candidatus Kaiserbacteria bacterium RIFCSPHIGHO2_12_FULL_53_13]OGG74205.1 MAG: hypothetical protein A3A37_00400 [Candidatus Kaiserbacteria bacterium RIFCSPLOWO2_01_FULL_52_36]